MDYGSLPLSGFLHTVRHDYGNWNRFICVVGLRCVEDGSSLNGRIMLMPA